MAWRLISLQHCNGSSSVEPLPQPTHRLTIEDMPALYFMAELKALQGLGGAELREIHQAKLAYPGQRIIQEGAEA